VHRTPGSTNGTHTAEAGAINAMTNAPPIPSLVVVYARDVARVAEFYRRTLSRPLIEEAPDFMVIGDARLEVVVVRMSRTIAEQSPVSTPPAVRTDTAVKASFLVEDFDHVHAHATATGGGTKPVSAAWEWRGQLHLDGHDPEGNVLQFRRRA
jgi:Glyoxalase-like domain